MTKELISLDAGVPALEAAKSMRDNDVGAVLVTRNGQLSGIVTDRDLVVRCLADGQEAKSVELGQLCTKEPLTLGKDSSIADAVKLMSSKAVRRVPVLDGNKPVGIVSLGDLAIVQDRDSALGKISAAHPNR